MGERARRSRDASSRFSIDTIFPGLSNNSSTLRVSSTPPINQAEGLESIQPPKSINIRETTCKGNESHDDPPNSLDKLALERKREESGMSNEGDVSIASSNTSSSSSSSSPLRKGSSGKSMWPLVAEGRSGASKRKAGVLRPATQPKQMYSPIGLTKLSRKGMFEVFQPWVLQTYGDSAKTKTITKKKYLRIVKTLRGEEINNAENSKFRFWVKAKGFHIGPPSGQPCVKDELGILQHPVPNEPDLYVPTTFKDLAGLEKPIFKRVAVVEYFFDIIYMVHVETEAKNGKHAGQKRTYRAITEKYAFLPREAVTKFLLQCTECQKRGSTPTAEPSSSGSAIGGIPKAVTVERSPSPSPSPEEEEEAEHEPTTSIYSLSSTATCTVTREESPPSFDINFGLPFRTSYLRQEERGKQMRGRDGFEEDEHVDELNEIQSNRMVKMSHSSSRKKLVPSKVKVKVRAPITSRDLMDHTSGDDDLDLRVKSNNKGSTRSKNEEGKDVKAEVSGAMDWLGYQPLGLKKETQTTNNNIYSNGKHEFREQSSPLSLSDRLAVNQEIGHDETSSNGNKDDEDDDDDESVDKMDTRQHDPERLKAFNMFVRLFVDENLDRMVPISKQPKEKIQAIIDSCTRQFPEFAERARKRIRTYLKSCRRNKRSRDGGWESTRPTPAHLTSLEAEKVLAQACDNESQNAKRMRMGLEPVSQPLPTPPGGESGNRKENGHSSSSSGGDSSPEKHSKVSSSSHNSSNIAATIAAVACGSNSISANVSNDQNLNLSLNGASSNGEDILNQLPSSLLGSKSMERSPLVDYSRALNGNGAASMSMYRPNFAQTFQRPSPFPSLFPAVSSSTVVGALGNSTFPQNVSPLPVANGDAGPTDLSMKSSMKQMTQKLNATELATVRQLITGYRESAAFLLRSADELEQLLIQQQ